MLTKEEKKIRAKKRQEQNIANGKSACHRPVVYLGSFCIILEKFFHCLFFYLIQPTLFV